MTRRNLMPTLPTHLEELGRLDGPPVFLVGATTNSLSTSTRMKSIPSHHLLILLHRLQSQRSHLCHRLWSHSQTRPLEGTIPIFLKPRDVMSHHQSYRGTSVLEIMRRRSGMSSSTDGEGIHRCEVPTQFASFEMKAE